MLALIQLSAPASFFARIDCRGVWRLVSFQRRRMQWWWVLIGAAWVFLVLVLGWECLSWWEVFFGVVEQIGVGCEAEGDCFW